MTAVGVCLLHAYANPAHERRVREMFAEEYPEAAVSIPATCCASTGSTSGR